MAKGSSDMARGSSRTSAATGGGHAMSAAAGEGQHTSAKAAGKDDITSIAVTQSPGNFFIFWNVVVLLSVLLDVLRFGMNTTEVMLILALLINPYLLAKIMTSYMLSFALVLYLIILLLRLLKRWPQYRIYTGEFVINCLLFFVWLAIPEMLMRYFWQPFCAFLYEAIKSADSKLTPDRITTYRNSILLIGSILILLHSIYIYNVYNGLTICFQGSFALKRRDDCCPTDCKQPKRRQVCSKTLYERVVDALADRFGKCLTSGKARRCS